MEPSSDIGKNKYEFPTTQFTEISNQPEENTHQKPVERAASVIFKTQFPPNSVVQKLATPLELKKWWMYNEWDSRCQFSKYVQAGCPDRNELDPQNTCSNFVLVNSVFEKVRGQFFLWGEAKENAKWKKVVVEKLELNWAKENIDILYPSEDQFKVDQLNGMVLWVDPTKPKYQLLEGNHRTSAWFRAQQPQTLPSILFIGKAAKMQ